MSLRPLEQCSQCRRIIYAKEVALIIERKSGKLTGKELKLCPHCRVQFFGGEIKDSSLDLDKKLKLSKWNEEESEIWTP